MQLKVVKWEEEITKADSSNTKLIYPLVLYLSSARLWSEGKTSELKVVPSRTDAYQRCLDSKRSSQFAFEYIKLLRNLAVEEKNGEPYPAYNVIMDAIKYSLSLHPAWQKRIVRILKTLFPRVEFICATHSPFIIQSLEDGELLILDGKIFF